MRRFVPSLAVAVLVSFSAVSLVGCHADDNDPKGQAEELDDPVRREHAVNRLQSIYGQLLVTTKGDRTQQPVKDFCDATHAQLTKVYLEHPEDTQNGLRILRLVGEMREPRTLPALIKALSWTAEITEEHAIAAASTMTIIEIPADKKSEVVSAVAAALERIDGARPVDNRMRKSFIEVLGKLGDKAATPTLIKVALTQSESQNFLFNILAAQQLVKLADPTSVPAMVKALYLFGVDNPAMRMNDVATSALVAVGRPALQPLLDTLAGKNADVKKIVDQYLAAIRQRDPNAAAQMNAAALISNEATFTLGKLGYREALEPLIAETKSTDEGVRFGAAIALVSINRDAGDTAKIYETLKTVYDGLKKIMRPQLLVAIRHLYAPEVMPFLLDLAKKPEDELPEIRLHAFGGYAMLANKAESEALKPIIDKEEDWKVQMSEYLPVLAAAAQCDENIDCWIGKLKDKDKVIVRKAANMLARYGRDNEKAIAGLADRLNHPDLEARVEILSALDFIATKGSKDAVQKIDDLEKTEDGRSIWNNFKREALPTRSRLLLRGQH
jgi:HEAT repeat protein